MKMFSSLLAVILVMAMVGNVVAQDDEEEYVKDFMEVAVYFGGAVPMGGLSDWSTTNLETGTEQIGTKFGFNTGFDVGHFLTMNLVLGLNFHYSQFAVDSDSTAVADMKHRIYSPALYVKYYFSGESNLVPYIRGQAGVDILKYATRVYDPNVDQGSFEYRELSYDPAFAFAFGAGLFYYTHDFGGLYIEANYRTALSSDVEAGYEGRSYSFGETASTLDVHAGIKVFFGSD